jgi:hypothetical protein
MRWRVEVAPRAHIPSGIDPPSPVEATNPFMQPRLVPGEPQVRQGWECPVCHIGQAPWMPYCGQCAHKKNLKTGTTNAEEEK